MSRLVLLVFVSGWCATRAANLPSTSLNLPIPEAVERGETVVAHVADTVKDRVQVEPTFRELTIKNYIHQAFIGVVNPTPIVDNIREEEKYGNNGDQLEGLGNAIVKGTEVGTQFLGKLVSIPGNTIRSVSGKVTQVLNGVGAHIVGL